MSSFIFSFRSRGVEHHVDLSTLKRFGLRFVLFTLMLLALDFGVAFVLEDGLRRYYGMNSEADVLCIGHSRTVLGIDADLLAEKLGVGVVKYAVNGANTTDRFAMIRHFLGEHPEVRLIIYDVESTTFSNDGLSSNSYRLFFPFMDDPSMGAYLRPQCHDATEFYLRKFFRTARYDEATFALSIRGFTGRHENLKFGRFDARRATRWIEQGKNRPVKIDPSNLRIFTEMIEYTRSRGVALLLVDMPQVDILNRAELPESETISAIFRSAASKYPHVMYLDLKRVYEHRHEVFYDMIHMNAAGQALVTENIATSIKARSKNYRRLVSDSITQKIKSRI